MVSTNEIRGFKFGKYRLDIESKRLSGEGEFVRIPRKAVEILVFLVLNRDRVVTKEELLERFWEEEYVDEKNLVQQIYRIRKEVNNDQKEEIFIETIPKSGYQFIAEVEEYFEAGFETAINKSHRDPSLLGDRNELLNWSGLNSSIVINDNISQETQHVDNFPAIPSTYEKDVTAKDFVLRFLRYKISYLVVVSIVIGVVGFYLGTVRQDTLFITSPRSIAVLPFSQIGGGSDDKLGLGIADTLISKLGNQQKVLISPTSTIIRFADKGVGDPIEIGKKLGVDAVLVGTIQKHKEIVRINVQLINVENGVSLLTDKFDEKFVNIFSLQDEIASKVSKKLVLNREAAAKNKVKSPKIHNVEAFRAYSQGLYYWNKKSLKGMRTAVGFFHQSVQEDPDFALGYAFLADCYAIIAMNRWDDDPRTAAEKAEEYVVEAEKLAPELSEIYATRGLISLLKHDLKRAKDLFQRAIELNPRNAVAHQRLGCLMSNERDLSDAIRELEISKLLDPLSVSTAISLARLLVLDRRSGEALTQIGKMEEILNLVGESLLRVEALEQQGKYEKALEVLGHRKDWSKSDADELIFARIFAKQGENRKALSVLTGITKPKKDIYFPYNLALVYLHLGRTTKALKILDEFKSESILFNHFRNDYNLDPIRGSSEFQALLELIEKNSKNTI